MHDIIDSHVHFWDPQEMYIPHLDSTPQLKQRKMAEEYAHAVKDTRVKAAVYIETDVGPCHKLAEAAWIQNYATQLKDTAEFGGFKAIVAYCPVHQGRVATQSYLRMLTNLMEPSHLLRGVRHLIQDPNTDPEHVAEPSFVQGVQVLADYGLSFELNIDCHAAPAQFPPLLKLVAQCPRVQFMLDHMAKPPCDALPGTPIFDHWKFNMFKLAEFDNVVCKVSGLVTETSTWTVAQLRPFVQVARDAFGIDRLLFGGDFPVCELATSWQTWLDLLSGCIDDWSEEDKQKLFVTNAARVYRLFDTSDDHE